MTITISVRMSDEEAQALQELVRQTGKTASEIVRESLRRHTVREQLAAVRELLVPRAQAVGWLTEEDVFRDVS